MKKTILALVILTLAACKETAKPEKHGEVFTGKIISLKKNIEQKYNCKGNECLFLAIWDYDGTILKGDCSEGLKEDGKVVFKGLVRLGIEKGYSSIYQPNEFEKFWHDYKTMEKKDHVEAYLYLLRVFAGTEVAKIETLAATTFDQVFSKYYFQTSLKMMKNLKEAGIDSHIISASADFFVKGGANSLGLSTDRINGIRVAIVDGKITKTAIQPVTYAAGKTERLKQLIATQKQATGAEHVFVLAGFGNSYGTDGDFLKFIVERDYRGYKPRALMINGGKEKEKYKGLFTLVEQHKVMGK